MFLCEFCFNLYEVNYILNILKLPSLWILSPGEDEEEASLQLILQWWQHFQTVSCGVQRGVQVSVRNFDYSDATWLQVNKTWRLFNRKYKGVPWSFRFVLHNKQTEGNVLPLAVKKNQSGWMYRTVAVLLFYKILSWFITMSCDFSTAMTSSLAPR